MMKEIVMEEKQRARIFRVGPSLMPWRVEFTPPLFKWWYYQAFFEWQDAITFVTDILGPDEAKRNFWLDQLWERPYFYERQRSGI